MKMLGMKHFLFYFITALLTFALGIAVASFSLLSQNRASTVIPIPESSISGQSDRPKVAQPPLTFKGVRCPNKTCNFDTRVCYESSDGVMVTLIQETYKSSAEAKEWLQLSLKNAINNGGEVFERAPVLNARGQRVGERIVIRHGIGAQGGKPIYSIEWTNGVKNDEVYSASLQQAIEFEKAYLAGKIKIHSYFDFDMPPPNNSFNASGD
jgi:hypothetical protein